VQGLDLFPTILRYLGLPIPPGTQGQPLREAEHPTVSELYYANARLLQSPVGHRFDRIARRIRVGEYAFIESSSGEQRLFHPALDPGETHDLIAERPEVASMARARLAAWLLDTPEARSSSRDPLTIDAETLQNLRALGYVQ
jgi:arylsulfatase A-like enzyme